MAIAQGRQAAEAVHAMLTGAAPARGGSPTGTPTHDVAEDFYAECSPVHVVERPVAERIAQADLEVHELGVDLRLDEYVVEREVAPVRGGAALEQRALRDAVVAEQHLAEAGARLIG